MVAKKPEMAVTEISHVYQLRHRCQNSLNMFSLSKWQILGYFGIGDVIYTRDLSLSQPFLAILATIAYVENGREIQSFNPEMRYRIVERHC